MSDEVAAAPAPAAPAKKLAAPYKDLTKANDLVTKNFLSGGSFAVTTETKAGDVTVKSSVKGSNKDAVSATIEPKYEWKANNLVFEGTLATTNTFTGKATVKNLVDGLSAYVKGERVVAKDVKNNLTAGLQFNNEVAHLVAECKVPLPDSSAVSVSTSLHAIPVEQAGLGLKLDYTAGGQVGYEAKLLGRQNDLEAALTYNSKKVVGVHFWRQHCSAFQFAAVVDYPLSEDTCTIPVTLAGHYKLDDFTSVKARLNVNIDKAKQEHVYRSGISLQQKLNDNTTVTVGADVNLNHAFGIGHEGGATSCGFELAFK